MVAVRNQDADRLLARLPSHVFAYLVFGTDSGLVSERTGKIVRSSVSDPHDPFQLVRIDGDQLATDPLRLVNEANTVALFGGHRAIWIEAEFKNFAAAVEKLFADPPLHLHARRRSRRSEERCAPSQDLRTRTNRTRHRMLSGQARGYRPAHRNRSGFCRLGDQRRDQGYPGLFAGCRSADHALGARQTVALRPWDRPDHPRRCRNDRRRCIGARLGCRGQRRFLRRLFRRQRYGGQGFCRRRRSRCSIGRRFAARARAAQSQARGRRGTQLGHRHRERRQSLYEFFAPVEPRCAGPRLAGDEARPRHRADCRSDPAVPPAGRSCRSDRGTRALDSRADGQKQNAVSFSRAAGDLTLTPSAWRIGHRAVRGSCSGWRLRRHCRDA